MWGFPAMQAFWNQIIIIICTSLISAKASSLNLFKISNLLGAGSAVEIFFVFFFSKFLYFNFLNLTQTFAVARQGIYVRPRRGVTFSLYTGHLVQSCITCKLTIYCFSGGGGVLPGYADFAWEMGAM